MKALRYLRELIGRYFSDRISQSAAELSYFLLFSIFPLLMVVSAVLGLLGVSPYRVSPYLELVPQSVRVTIVQYLTYAINLRTISPLVVGSVLTLYFLSRVMRSLMRTTNRIYRVQERSGIVREVVISMLLTGGVLGAVVLSLVVVVVGRMLTRQLPNVIPALTFELLSLLLDAAYPVIVVFLFLFLLIFNRVVPNRRLRWREVVAGTLFSLAAWLFISLAFSFYVDNLARYSVLYGSLAAIIVLMLWLYLMSIVLLLGPLVNHILLTQAKEESSSTGEEIDMDHGKEKQA